MNAKQNKNRFQTVTALLVFPYSPFFLLFIFFLIVSCKKEPDTPPIHEIPAGSILTINDLWKMYSNTSISFTSDYSVYAVVTADEGNGNLYKNIFVQDNTGGIQVRLLSSGGLYQGDSIRISLKGTVLSNYKGTMQLDSVDVDKNVVVQKQGVEITPQIVTIRQIVDDTASIRLLQSKLVKLENIEFLCSDLGNTYADAVNQKSVDRYIVSCDSDMVIVRTSGYANFAGEKVPEGNGSLVAIVGEYNGTKQLTLRSLPEVNMSGTRCLKCPPLNKDFEDNSITSGGWTMQNVSGTINWTTNSVGSGQGGQYYAQCSNYISPTNYACETWLISPSVDLTGTTSPVLSFINAYKYSGPAMELYISTDYSSGLPSAGTWTTLAFTASSGNFAWVNSGNIALSSYKTSNVHIAFKYTGTSSTGSTWEIDDIAIKDN